MRTTHPVLAALVALTTASGCGLQADQLAVAAPAAASASPTSAAPAPSPSPAAAAAEPSAEASAEPAPPTAPPAGSPAATPVRRGPCAPRPPAASSVALRATLSFPTSVVTPRTRGTLTVTNVGTTPVHVSGRAYVGTATVDGDVLTSTAASTSDYVAPVELGPGEQRSYSAVLVGQPCPGGQPDWDRPLPSGRYQVVALLHVQEVEGLAVASEAVEVEYEAEQ